MYVALLFSELDNHFRGAGKLCIKILQERLQQKSASIKLQIAPTIWL